jgi:hypothetical protein
MMLFEKSQNYVEIIEQARKYQADIRGLDDEEKRILNVALEILEQMKICSFTSRRESDLSAWC